ncbi:ABC transporter [Beauveria bassiana ARSEF 2860]|uniref:ABC transporter n=1 Tax=Beauveria bassiana (strain ARSEF 2860) TaxID=655819 RepID=J4KLL0_BEAB2|nr:ABC transporter [Beauveria bassiana ARSEF 2860]EJP62389.1 ABC transporter [Beauveria bassiana ARSEF 2860]
MASLSVIVLAFQLLRQQHHAPGRPLLHQPVATAVFEPIGQFLNVTTLCLFIAARETHHQATNALLLGYVCLLQLARTIGPERNRQALRGHIDAMLVGTFGFILVMEGLSLALIGSGYSVTPPTMRAAASLLCSVCVAVVAPHEWLAPVDASLGDLPEPTFEETCSWVDYLFTYARASSLVRGGDGEITLDRLDKLPSAYNPELWRRRFSETRKTHSTMTRALVSLLWAQLLLCTTLGVLFAAAQLVSPMGLYCLLDYMQHPDEAIFQPRLWLLVICGGRITQTAFQQAYSSHSRKLAAQVNAMLTAEVFHSALASRELHGNFLSSGETADGQELQSTASGILENLISSDIQSITGLQDVLFCVTAIPAAATAAFGLYQLVGWPCLVGIALALSGSPFETWLMSYVEHHEEQLKTAQDLRISLVSEYLRSIKIIKYFGWEESAAKNIAQARTTEQKHIHAIDIFSIGLSLIANFFPILSLVSILALHVGIRKLPLTASTAYTTIQLLQIVSNCLVFLALVRVEFSRAMVSLRRFDRFFKSLTPLDTYTEGDVEIRDGTFQRAKGTEFHLRDINIKFFQNGLNVVTGTSGSGKTSLLLALLGETHKKSGSVVRQKDAAYSSQTPWLQAGTIQENILFYNAYDEKRYGKVVDACCLTVDFEEMEHGDQTVIGSGTVALSGGQQARVALARALYSSASLLLLDDIFSALDTRTSLELWNGVFCSDLLQKRTVILVTQNTWIADEANVVIVMDNGRVQSVSRREGHVRKAKPIQKIAVSGELPAEPRTYVPADENTHNEESEAVVADQERPVTGSVSSLLGSLIATLTVATCFLHTGAGIYTNYWLSRWVGRADGSESSILYYLMVYIGLSYLTEAIDGIRMMAFSRGIMVAAGRLHVDVINAVMAAPLSWFTEQAISETLNSLSGDISCLDQSIYNSIVSVISNIIQSILMIGTIASNIPVFPLPAIALLTIGCFIARMYEGASHHLTDMVSSSRSPILSNFSEGLTGSIVIRAASSGPLIFHAKMNRLLCASSRAQHALSNASQWQKFRMSVLATAINILAASLALSQRGAFSAGLAGFGLSQATQLSDKVLATIFSFTSLSLDMQIFQRVRGYTKLAREEDCTTDSSKRLPASWPRTGSVELQNVTVRYNPTGHDILKNISLRIEPGERIAIVGRTGSGKSTLILSLLGFTHIESGKIFYDGIDLKSIPRRRLRQSISTIPQEPQLFQGTIASNLDPSGTIPESELQNALRICQSLLQATDQLEKSKIASADSSVNSAFTERLSLSTIVKSKGENFSHGQRQVLSLCRVLIRHSKLVLLDEATWSMDAGTDAGVQQALRQELLRAGGEKRALVTVAHRLQTIMDYDRVVVMGSGTILEVGSPKHLLAKKGVFYDMVKHSEEKHTLSD